VTLGRVSGNSDSARAAVIVIERSPLVRGVLGSNHMGFVVDQHRVREFSLGSLVSYHFFHSTNSPITIHLAWAKVA